MKGSVSVLIVIGITLLLVPSVSAEFCFNSACSPDKNTMTLLHADENIGHILADSGGNYDFEIPNSTFWTTDSKFGASAVNFTDDADGNRPWNNSAWNTSLWVNHTTVTNTTETWPDNGTIEFWFKFKPKGNDGNKKMYLYEKIGQAGNYFSSIYYNPINDQIRFETSDGLGSIVTVDTNSTNKWENDTWYHYAVTWSYSSNEIKVYINNSIDNSTTDAITIPNNGSASNFTFGNDLGANYGCNCTMDEIRVSNVTREKGYIKIVLPTNSTISNGTFDLNVSNVSFDVDTISWLYVINGNISESNTSFTPNTTLETDMRGQNNITVWANDTTGVNNFMTTEWFFLQYYGYNSEDYENESINGRTDTYILVLDVFNTTDIVNISANLTWNGTNYNISSQTNTSNNYTFSQDITIPFIDDDTEEITFWWNFTIYYSDCVNDTNGTAPHNVTVFQVIITNCSSDLTNTTILIVNLTHEITFNPIEGSLQANFLLWKEGMTPVNNTFDFPNTSAQTNFSFCIYPNWTQFNANATIEYTASSFVKRYYYLVNSTLRNDTTEYILLYLIESWAGGGEQIDFVVKDTYGNERSDVLIKALRYYVGGDEYLTVAMTKTGFDGGGAMYLQKDVWYRFILEEEGIVIRSFNPKILTEDDLTLWIADEEQISLWVYHDSIAHSCSFNNATNVLACVVTDTSGKMVSSTLQVQEKKLLGNFLLLCTDTSTASSTTLSCDLTGYTSNTTLYYSLTGFFVASPATTFSFETGYLSFITPTLALGLMGVLIAFLITITFGFIGSWHPATAIIFTMLGVVISMSLGLITIGFETIGGIWIVATLLVYKMRR